VITDHVDPAPPVPPDVEIRWQCGLPSGATAALRAAAIVADGEMGFSAALAGEVWRPDSAVTASVFTHLRRHDVPAAPGGHLAAVLTAAPLDDGVGVVDLVVAPVFRSMGVATSVIESLLRRAASETPFERVLSCSYGSHPAGSRLAARFAAVSAGSRTHLTLPSRTDFESSRAVGVQGPGTVTTRVLGHGSDPTVDEWTAFREPVHDRIRLEVLTTGGQVIGYADVSRTDEVGAVHDMSGPEGGPIGFDIAVQVVCAAVRYLTDDGATSVHADVNSPSGAEFDAFRAAAFQRDRTDLLFTGAPQEMRRRLRAHDVPE
jgi:GNAT superfamily N-acetyltransferase